MKIRTGSEALPMAVAMVVSGGGTDLQGNHSPAAHYELKSAARHSTEEHPLQCPVVWFHTLGPQSPDDSFH